MFNLLPKEAKFYDGLEQVTESLLRLDRAFITPLNREDILGLIIVSGVAENQTQSSVTALLSLKQQIDVSFCRVQKPMPKAYLAAVNTEFSGSCFSRERAHNTCEST